MEPARAALPQQRPRGTLLCMLDMARSATFKGSNPLFGKDFA